jgi:hypothetical protein
MNRLATALILATQLFAYTLIVSNVYLLTLIVLGVNLSGREREASTWVEPNENTKSI